MRDRETGTWWQQVSGKALHGPLKGKRLNLIAYEEVTFDLWKQERPGGRVLLPDPEIQKEESYAKEDWEQRIAKLPVVTPINHEEPLKPRDLILGIDIKGQSKAYPFESLKRTRAIVDKIAGGQIILVLGKDDSSVRVFEAVIDGKPLSLYFKNETGSDSFLDVDTGTEWSFEGVAVTGPLAGKKLNRISVLKDYWFDWKNYHPETAVYLR